MLVTEIARFGGGRHIDCGGRDLALHRLAAAWHHHGLEIIAPELATDFGYQNDSVSWFVVVALAIFTMLFGTRHIDNTEHHRGMMMAIAFESIIKLLAFWWWGFSLSGWR